MKKKLRSRNPPRFYRKPLFQILMVLVLIFAARIIYLNSIPFPVLSIPDIPQIDKLERVEKPNIVIILLDDLDDTLTPFWDAMPATKKLIKERGMTFANSFSPNPLCCPARASLLTGKYSHNTGVFNNDGKEGGWQMFYKNGNEDETIAVYLKNAGYKTTHIGKYLNGIENNPTHIPPGWTDWQGGVGRAIYTGYNYTFNENGKIVTYGSKPEDYLTDVITKKAVNSIIEADIEDDVPFLLSLAPTAPHYPLPEAPRHRNHPYRFADLPETANYNEEDLSDKPEWLKSSQFTRSLFLYTTDWDYRQRMGSLYAVDEMVASVISSLHETGELGNTYIIFTSDNGYNNGSHKLIQKMAPYEESLRVPLVISGPGIKKASEYHFALTIDLAPTILELAEVSLPSKIDGMSLTSFLFDEDNVKWRKDFLVQHKIGGLASEFNGYPWILDFVTDFIDVPSYTALRTEDFLYIEWDTVVKKEYELYDLKKDPNQLNNILNKSNKNSVDQDLIRELKNRLVFLKTCKGSTCKVE